MEFINRQLHETHNGVYILENKINGKVYVGSAFWKRGNGLVKRFTQYANFKHTYFNKKLANAFNKYGKDNFVFKVARVVDDSESVCRKTEEEFILKYDSINNGYNVKCQGVGGNGGANLGKKYPKPSKELISRRGAGVSRAMKGRKKSLKHCIAMSKAKSGINSKANKPVFLTDIKTDEVIYFYSQVEAAKQLACCVAQIWCLQTGRSKLLQYTYKKATLEEITRSGVAS
jgi:group I intron endonuclease